MMPPVEEKSMVSTVLVGLGGTGHEVLSRVRRLIEETYGSLNQLPIISFLKIDTDKGHKIENPDAAGSPFRVDEIYEATISGTEAQKIVSNMENYPYINRWFPTELEKNLSALESGAGQIRACGRFAFFHNYSGIKQKFSNACAKVSSESARTFMLDSYGIKVSGTALNVIIVGSLSGGTGSGMIIDMGYCIRRWLQLRGQQTPMTTAIIPMPTNFSNIQAGDRVLANGYAALMEISYFSDNRTEYRENFSAAGLDEVRSQLAPFDFTYLVGNGNSEEGNLDLPKMREIIAQNIFLDLTSDFGPHKRSIRDNIKGSWMTPDPGGRGYPKNFMSLGISMFEVPINLIYRYLNYRLGSDLCTWWQNSLAVLPPDMYKVVRNLILKPMRLLEAELLADLASAGDKSYQAVIESWINEIRDDVATDNKLECTKQGITILGDEQGKIRKYVSYLQSKNRNYRITHLQDMGSDERNHGDFLKKMYDNRDNIIKRAKISLEKKLYEILENRFEGAKFAEEYIEQAIKIFNADKKKSIDAIGEIEDKSIENTWRQESDATRNYEEAINNITQDLDRYGIEKQNKMRQYSDIALTNLEISLQKFVERKSKALHIQVLDTLLVFLDERLKTQKLNRWNQKVKDASDFFTKQSELQSDSIDALEVNGEKLFDRDELNILYQNLIESYAIGSSFAASRLDEGKNQLFSLMSADVLKQASPLWKDNRAADEVMGLLDVSEINDNRKNEFIDIIAKQANIKVVDASPSTILMRDMTACDRLFRKYNDNETEIRNRIQAVYNKSKPLIVLSEAIMNGADAGFTPPVNTKVAIIGGSNTTDITAQRFIGVVGEFVNGTDSFAPLGEQEKHRVVFVQEIGGFSLRCISAMQQLRESYQDWLRQMIKSKRSRLEGGNDQMPIPVHSTKNHPFWDIFPEDNSLKKLLIKARATGVLYTSQNRSLKEDTICFTRKTAFRDKSINVASSWEEVIQVLLIPSFQDDKQEIDFLANTKLANAKTDEQKQILFDQFRSYLEYRSIELAADGGLDSPIYRFEENVIENLVAQYKLGGLDNE